jgi:hypothetical protein
MKSVAIGGSNFDEAGLRVKYRQALRVDMGPPLFPG